MGVTVREKERGSKIWWVFVRKGRQLRTSVRVGRSKRAAQLVAAEIERKLAIAEATSTSAHDLRATLRQVAVQLDPSVAARTAPTVRQYAALWINENSAHGWGWKKSTRQNYESILRNHLLPEFGDLPLTDIKRRHVRVWLADKARRDGLSTKTVKNLHRALSSMLSSAVTDEYLEINPIKGTRDVLPRVRVERRPPKAWTPDQMQRLLDAAHELCESDDQILLFELLAATGLRIGEAVGLRWDDLDLERGEVLVQRARVRGEETSTKGRRHRVVPIAPALASRLTALRTRQERRALAEGRENAPWVVQSPLGGALESDNLRHRTWKRLVRRAKVPDHGFHGFRHTRVTSWLRAGVPLFTVSRLIGHASIQTTADVYGHVLPDVEIGVNPALVAPTVAPYEFRTQEKARRPVAVSD